jgi:plastocyanin
MKRTALLLVVVAALAVFLVGCSSSKKKSTAGGTASASASSTAPVIKNFEFSPNPIKVKVGTKVTWTNQDDTDHAIQADDNSFSSAHLAQGMTFSFTFTKAGTYTYHCAIHTYMKGTVVVG